MVSLAIGTCFFLAGMVSVVIVVGVPVASVFMARALYWKDEE